MRLHFPEFVAGPSRLKALRRLFGIVTHHGQGQCPVFDLIERLDNFAEASLFCAIVDGGAQLLRIFVGRKCNGRLNPKVLVAEIMERLSGDRNRIPRLITDKDPLLCFLEKLQFCINWFLGKAFGPCRFH